MVVDVLVEDDGPGDAVDESESEGGAKKTVMVDGPA